MPKGASTKDVRLREGAGELSLILMSSIYSSYFMKDLCPSENITASFHPHPLRLKDAHEMPYYCAGCKEKGLGKCYQCEDPENCDYHLHQQCYELSTLSRVATPPPSNSHSWRIRNATLYFRRKPQEPIRELVMHVGGT
ncbi:hypothetical protein CK203_010219 [Vitis vinifera]|uniref:DC1 domain-containing protein n=1 Tax=Vitis vinifera TaxID=29760 RepID=A0A438JXR3_VITVI|nr:hypothetical protein CK203_010219 [Vitis vinifera]